MDKLIKFINSFIDYSEVIQAKNKLILKFDYFDKVNEVITYENIKSLVETYPNTIKLFIKFNNIDEVDLVDFIDDISDFNDELNSLEKNKSKFQIIISFTELINLNNDLKNKDIEIYYNEKFLLEKLNVKDNDYRKLRNYFLKR
ncbi:MAG: hypothetical protein ACLVKE_09940 [Clostridium baratii]